MTDSARDFDDTDDASCFGDLAPIISRLSEDEIEALCDRLDAALAALTPAALALPPI